MSGLTQVNETAGRSVKLYTKKLIDDAQKQIFGKCDIKFFKSLLSMIGLTTS